MSVEPSSAWSCRVLLGEMTWNTVIGHESVKRLWQAHLDSGRIPNAYLLAGPDGIGKRRLALELAKALNCTAESARPCDQCMVCSQMARQAHPDLHVLSPGGASDQIKIEEMRQLIGRVALRPFGARMQVAIIDGAERFTEEAANSFLKVLEEPSSRTRFVLLTAQLSHCLPTIVSRCQLLRCRPLPDEAIRRILVEQRDCAPQAADAIARLAGGSASAALELAARWDAYRRTVDRFATAHAVAWLTQPLPDTRQDVMQLVEIMMAWLRDVAVTASTGDPARAAHPMHEAALRRQASTVDLDRCVETALALVELRESVERFVSPRLVAAMARERWLALQERT